MILSARSLRSIQNTTGLFATPGIPPILTE